MRVCLDGSFQCGEVAKRLTAPVLKPGKVKALVGSNLTLSAIEISCPRLLHRINARTRSDGILPRARDVDWDSHKIESPTEVDASRVSRPARHIGLGAERI